MKKAIALIFLFSPLAAFAEGPSLEQKEKYSGTIVQQEFENVYKDLRGKAQSLPSGTSGQTLISGGSGSPYYSTDHLGTPTNNDAPVGFVGEYKSSTTGGGFVSFPASAVNGDAVSVLLTPGDWDVWGLGEATLNGATMSGFTLFLGTVAGDNVTGQTVGLNRVQCLPPSASFSQTCGVQIRASLSANTTYYLKTSATYTVATPKVAVSIQARRFR